MFCDGGTWRLVRTFLKHNVKYFLVAVAADAGGRVTNIELEAKGQLATNNRPGDVAGIDNGKAFAVDVFITRVGSATNRGKSVDKVNDEADAVKRAHNEKSARTAASSSSPSAWMLRGVWDRRLRTPSATSRTVCRVTKSNAASSAATGQGGLLSAF